MRKIVLLVISVLILLTGCSSASSEIVIENETPQVQDDAAFLASYDAPVADPTIFVYVCGAVESPGVYELDEGSRVIALLV